jgi:sulfoacetaldehyde dehydrogenase
VAERQAVARADRARRRRVRQGLRAAGRSRSQEILHGGGDRHRPLAVAVYRAKDFDDAIRIANDILAFQGRGHSIGLHTKDFKRGNLVAERSDVVRVLINQAHTFGNGGSFDNALNFTLSMGCGTWGGNSITDNLNYTNFLNITHLVTTIPEDKPTEEDLFGEYWKKYGR